MNSRIDILERIKERMDKALYIRDLQEPKSSFWYQHDGVGNGLYEAYVMLASMFHEDDVQERLGDKEEMNNKPRKVKEISFEKRAQIFKAMWEHTLEALMDAIQSLEKRIESLENEVRNLRAETQPDYPARDDSWRQPEKEGY